MAGINKTPSGIPSGANKPEDGDKSLPESNEKGTQKAQAIDPTAAAEQAKVAPGVVQEDNIPSNDHGTADPRNNERSEYDESLMNVASVELPVQVTGVEDGEVAYSSHPIANYAVGKFKFDNGVLKLSKREDIDEFEKVLDDLPESERIRIRKLDIEKAEAISREVRGKSGPRSTQQTDSSVGDRGEKTKSGTVDLAKASDGGAVK